MGAAISHALRMGPTEDAVTAKTIADSAVKDNVTSDQAAAAKVLQDLYAEAAALAAPDTVLNDLPGMADLLAQANITIKGITDTQMDQMATAIRDGLVNGSSHDVITASVNSVIGDPARAAVIAETETTRGFAQATMDTYAANNIDQYNFVNEDDPCPQCIDAAEDSPYQVGSGPQPPLHPNCECYTDAVTP